MKKLVIIFMCSICLVSAAYTQETVVLWGSNQNITTLGFEMNEYDYLIDPFSFSLLSDPWIFFALDSSVAQLAADIVGDGFRFGWAPGGRMTPVFLFNYYTNMTQLDSAREADNIEFTRTGYDTTTGLYASIVEDVNQDLAYNRNIHDSVLHGGFTLSDTLALAFQFGLAMDRYVYQNVQYTNTYTNAAAASAASLSTRGARTDTLARMRLGTDNHYALDTEAALDLGTFRSRLVLGTGWYNPTCGNDMHQETVTTYNAGGGLDDTVRDQEQVTTYSGQYYLDSGVSPNASFSMGNTAVSYAEFFRVGLDTENTLAMGSWDLTIPFIVRFDLYPQNQQTVYSVMTVYYDDADSSADGTETGRDGTTTTTTLNRTLDMAASTGAEVYRSFEPTSNTALHVGGSFGFTFDAASDTKAQEQSQVYQEDNDGGGYATAGTDVSWVYTQSGYEEQNRVFQYDFDLGVDTAVSYSPVDVLTFHAGASVGLSVDLTSTSTLTTGSAAFVYEQYTDTLDSANSYLIRQKDASTNNSIPSTLFSTDVTFSTSAVFGFTLVFSDAFKVDARAVSSGNVGFEEFSVLGMYSY